VQGEDGFMWFGTNNGLVRYDGYEFVVYSHNPNNVSSISGDYISALAPVNERLMWVGLYEKGLDLFDTQSGKTIFHIDEQTIPKLPDNRIQRLWVEKEKNRLWICSMKNHFIWLDLVTLTITIPTPVKHPESTIEVPETNTVYAIERVKNSLDNYWMATNDGLVLYDEKTNNSWYHQIPVTERMAATSNRMRTMLCEEDKIWTLGRN
jgi:ligand-binding sensor domain-containing protein